MAKAFRSLLKEYSWVIQAIISAEVIRGVKCLHATVILLWEAYIEVKWSPKSFLRRELKLFSRLVHVFIYISTSILTYKSALRSSTLSVCANICARMKRCMHFFKLHHKNQMFSSLRLCAYLYYIIYFLQGEAVARTVRKWLSETFWSKIKETQIIWTDYT